MIKLASELRVGEVVEFEACEDHYLAGTVVDSREEDGPFGTIFSIHLECGSVIDASPDHEFEVLVSIETLPELV